VVHPPSIDLSKAGVPSNDAPTHGRSASTQINANTNVNGGHIILLTTGMKPGIGIGAINAGLRACLPCNHGAS